MSWRSLINDVATIINYMPASGEWWWWMLGCVVQSAGWCGVNTRF